MQDDYAAFRDERPSDNLTAVLRSLADDYLKAEAEVTRIEEELAVAKTALKDIAEVTIPQATDGMDGEFNLGDGRKLIIKEEIRSSIAGEKRIPAIQWLDENDYGHIVKREVIFSFGKGDEERCRNFIDAVKKLSLNLVFKSNDAVHHATLNSWVKERLGEGDTLPNDIFGIFRQRTAKVKEI